MADAETDDTAKSNDPGTQPETEGVDLGGDKSVGYAPSAVESTRTRMQGGGVGQTDLNQQRDPTRYDSSEKT